MVGNHKQNLNEMVKHLHLFKDLLEAYQEKLMLFFLKWLEGKMGVQLDLFQDMQLGVSARFNYVQTYWPKMWTSKLRPYAEHFILNTEYVDLHELSAMYYDMFPQDEEE